MTNTTRRAGARPGAQNLGVTDRLADTGAQSLCAALPSVSFAEPARSPVAQLRVKRSALLAFLLESF